MFNQVLTKDSLDQLSHSFPIQEHLCIDNKFQGKKRPSLTAIEALSPVLKRNRTVSDQGQMSASLHSSHSFHSPFHSPSLPQLSMIPPMFNQGSRSRHNSISYDISQLKISPSNQIFDFNHAELYSGDNTPHYNSTQNYDIIPFPPDNLAQSSAQSLMYEQELLSIRSAPIDLSIPTSSDIEFDQLIDHCMTPIATTAQEDILDLGITESVNWVGNNFQSIPLQNEFMNQPAQNDQYHHPSAHFNHNILNNSDDVYPISSMPKVNFDPSSFFEPEFIDQIPSSQLCYRRTSCDQVSKDVNACFVDFGKTIKQSSSLDSMKSSIVHNDQSLIRGNKNAENLWSEHRRSISTGHLFDSKTTDVKTKRSKSLAPAFTPAQSDLLSSDGSETPRHQVLKFDEDMYTPTLVRFAGSKKEGLCQLCTPTKWLQLKTSAFWYHKQFSHGISSITGRPFPNPLEIRSVWSSNDDLSVYLMTEGKCHHCLDWHPLYKNKKRYSFSFGDLNEAIKVLMAPLASSIPAILISSIPLKIQVAYSNGILVVPNGINVSESTLRDMKTHQDGIMSGVWFKHCSKCHSEDS